MNRIKIVLMIFALAALSNCGGQPLYVETAPGTPLPSGIAVCKERDTIGRCKRWLPASETCINPKGVDVDPPTVPCASIRK